MTPPRFPRLRALFAGDSWTLYRRLLAYAWPYRRMFLVAVLGMVLLSVSSGGLAALMKPLIDEGFVNRDTLIVRLMPPLIVGIFILRAIANFLSQYGTSWVGRRVTYDIREAVFRHLVRLPSGFYDRNASGNLMARLTFNVEQISAGVTNSVFVIVGDGLTLLALFAWVWYLNWKLTLLFLVMLPFSSLLVRAMSRRFRRASHEIQASVGGITHVTQEAIEGQRIVKAFDGADTETRAFSQVNEHNRRQSMRKVATSAVGMGLLQILGALMFAGVIYFALSLKDITAGTFTSYIAAVTMMMGPSRRLAKVNEVVQTALAAAQSVFVVLDEPPEEDSGTVEIARAKGDIEYRDVHFRYPVSEAPALQGVSFRVEPGQMLALVGASGSGKTTCASLLPRFYRVERGAIVLDGVDINDLRLANLRAQISIVGQESLLFDDTLRNNITYGAKGPIDDVRVREAAQAAHVLEFAERLPQGLDTPVGEKGLRLSGGQRQRVAIARALFKNAPILILDEATSALDTESERLVQEAMRRLMKNRTSLVIAHRLSTIEHADRIVVLAGGRVAESGTHAELLARNGVYANLYRSQFDASAA